MALPKVLANFETSLASKLSSSATTGTLNTSTDPEGNTLSGQYILTLDEGTSSEEHVLATLSGASITTMTRGLDRTDGSTNVAGNQKEHSRGASVKITNMNLLLINDLINGNTQFDADNIMEYDAEPSFTTASNEICTVKFAEDQANAGAADMSTTQKGIAEEATQAEIDADTAAGGTGARLAINPSTLATSKYGTQLPSSDEKDALAGTSGTPSTSNKYVTADDVTEANTASKIARRDSNGDILVATTPTDSDAAVSLTYFNNNIGSLIGYDLTDTSVTNTTTETNLLSFTLSGGTLGTGNGVKIEAPITDLDMLSTVGSSGLTIRLKYGATTIATAVIGENISNNKTNLSGKIEALLFANASTSAQEGSVSINIFGLPTFEISSADNVAIGDVAAGTAAEVSTGDLTLSITAQWSNANTNNNITIPHYVVTKL